MKHYAPSDFQGPFVEISDGIIKGGDHPDLIGQRRFFLDYYPGDGGNACVWDGPTYEAALVAASEWRQDGVPVVDNVKGSAQ